jgi:flagellin
MSQFNGLSVAMRNANDGISMLQVAEGAMQQVTDNLLRMRDLSLQAANGSNGSSEKAALQQEVNQLLQEINRINDTTRFGGKDLFSRSGSVSYDEDYRAVLMGLKGPWLREAENRIKEFFGIKADGFAMALNITEGTVGGALASVSATGTDGSGRWTGLSLNIEMADFRPANLPNGGSAPFYNDRIIAHEVVHAVMSRSMSFQPLPSWFKEGAAEFIHGADERVEIDYNGGAGLATIVAAFNADDVSASAGYSAGYGAVRYMHERIKAAGGEGIKDIMEYLSNNLGSTLSTALTNASSGAFASLAAFNTAFNNDAAALYASFNFNNDDTGAIGGYDVDRGNVLTAESVLSDTGTGVPDKPLANFNFSVTDFAIGANSGSATLFQVGAQANETIAIVTGGVSADSLGLTDLDLVTNAGFATMYIDEALTAVDETRGRLGAAMNRFQATISNLGNVQTNIAASNSRIRDADYANETANLTKNQVLQQAGLAVLQQANSSQNSVLQLLRA